jgi:hypothetical protein
MGVDLYMEPNFEDYSCQVKEFKCVLFDNCLLNQTP